MKINGVKVGLDHVPYFIAEAGVNHEQSKYLSRALVDIASWANVDAFKVQTGKADLLVAKSTKKARYQQENLRNSDSQYEMIKKLELDENGHELMKKVCAENQITFLSTPHSNFWSVDYLDSLGVPAFKIGSGDLTNFPILEYIAKKQKPVILSTGMANLEETMEGIDIIQSTGNNQLIVLHCTTNYPCPLEDVNLRAMQTIAREFKVLVGYSDHTQGIEIPIMATAMGASVIEKHFTIDQNILGNSPDHTSSLTPSQLKSTVEAIKFVKERGITDPIEAVHSYYKEHSNTARESTYSNEDLETALGNGIKKPTEKELEIMPNIRKSIISTREIKAGQTLTKENVDIKRPMGGFPPKHYENLTSGKVIATKDISLDDPINGENCNMESKN